MKKLFLMMFVLTLSIVTMAQTSLRGRVIDRSTQTPVVGAKVTLANHNISTTTNASGEFVLLYLDAMDEEAIIEADGYVASLELVQLQADQANELEIVLQQDIVSQAQDEILLNLTEEEMTDDEGRSQAQASSSSASTDRKSVV